MDDIFVTITEGTDDTFVTLQEGSDDIVLTIEDVYILPTASATIKGGIRIGSGLSVDGDVLSTVTQVQSDFAQTDSDEPDFIKNKPSIPTETSDLINDSGFITIEDLGPYATTSGLTIALASKSDTTHNHSLANLTEKSYNSLTDRPVIPDELKDLTDDTTHRTVTDTEKTTWNNKLGSFTETDPVFISSPANSITSENVAVLNNTSGTNTGDQDLSGYATTSSLTNGLASKVDKVTGKGLSAEDYTTAEKNKLSGIAENANNYVLPSDVVQDSSYVHTDNNFTDDEQSKLTGLDPADYEPANVNIQSHISSTSNPHSVTSVQVGLGSCDNTSDLNKPISTAVQTELNRLKNFSIAMAVAL